MRFRKWKWAAVGAALIGGAGQAAQADLLMLLEGDKANGPNAAVALDSSANGAHAMMVNAGLTDDGRTGGALNFTGDASYAFTNQASMGLGALNGINESQQFTIAFWMSGGESNPKASSVFWAEGETPNGGNRAIQSHATWSNGNVYLDIGGCCSDTQRLAGPMAEEFYKGSVGEEWTHMAYTMNGDGDVRIYIDGQVEQDFLAERAGPTDAIPTFDNFWLATEKGGGNYWEGRMDDFFVTDNALSEDDIAAVIADGARSFFGVTGEPADYTPQVIVANNAIGALSLSGDLSDIVRSEPKQVNGLAQYWYDANMRANPEGFLAAGDTGTEEFPLVNTDGPIATSTTWWAGGGNPNVISDMELQRYPGGADGLTGTRFDGSANENNYSVRLTGEIFIPEDGDYLIRDGIDDFTMIAIDQDGNGELDDLDGVTNADVGSAGFGDVVVLDDDWANIDGSSQPADFHGFAEMDGIAAGGEWRKIEIWMSEGGGGDAGIVYMANLDDPDVFDDTVEEALSQEARDKFVIRNEDLRSTVSVVESANSATTLDTGVEYVMQVGADGNDQIVVADGDGRYNTTLDVTGATIVVEAGEGIAEGTVFQLLDADNITGADSLTVMFDDPSKWTLNLAEGTITYGAGSPCDPNSMGDLNGDGAVGFPDFLLLSANFGNEVSSHTEGDVNCDGSVGFPDFLILSANFGQTVGQAASVPEPSGVVLLSVAGLAMGLVRRRR